MKTKNPQLPAYCPHPITRLLRAFRRRRQTDRLLAVALATVGVMLLVLLAGLTLDRVVEVAPQVRLIPLVLLGLSAAAGLVVLVIVFVRGSRDPERTAAAIDARVPDSYNTLHSAVNFLTRMHRHERPGHEFLVDESVLAAGALAEQVRLSAVCPWRSPRRLGLPVLGLLGIFILLAALPMMSMRLLLVRFFDPFGNYPRPSWTRIHTDLPMHSELEAGSDLNITAHLSGRRPEPRACYVRIVRSDGEERLPLQPLPDGSFRGQVRGVRRGFAFYLEAGDGRTARREVNVLHPPRITQVTARYVPPRYARIEEHTETVDNRRIRALTGTVVTVNFTADRPVREGYVTVETEVQARLNANAALQAMAQAPDGGKTAMGHFLAQKEKRLGGRKPKTVRKRIDIEWLGEPDPAGPSRGRFVIRLERSALMRIQLQSPEGVWNRFDPSYKIVAIPDNPPTISIVNLPETVTVRQDDVLRVRYHAGDDLGIAALNYRARKQMRHQDVEEYVPLAKFGARSLEGEIAIPVRELAPESKYRLAGSYQDSTFDFMLGASDLKGQTGMSRRIRITVLFETYDRSMDELLGLLQEQRDITAYHGQQVQRGLNSLTILRDSLGENGTWQKPHTDQLQRIISILGRQMRYHRHSVYHRLRAYHFSYYPYRAQRAADLLLAYLPCRDGNFGGLVKIAESKRPWKQLGAASEAIQAHHKLITDHVAAIDEAITMMRADVLLYLVELSRRELARFEGGADEEFVDLFKAKLATRITKIQKLAAALKLTESGPTAEGVEKLLQAKAKDELPALAAAFDAVREALMRTPAITANAGQGIEKFLITYDGNWLATQGGREEAINIEARALDRLTEVWDEYLSLGWDRTLTNEPRMAARALALLRVRSGMKEADKVLDVCNASRRAAAWYTLLTHANTALQEGRSFLEGHDVDRLKPGDPEAERTWTRFRDVALVLADQARAGRFNELHPELKTTAAQIDAFRDLLVRWDFETLTTRPADRRRLTELLALLTHLRAKLADTTPPRRPAPRTIFSETCARLAALMEAERVDALRHMELLRKEMERPAPPKDTPKEKLPKSVANAQYGMAKEQVLLRYATAYRKTVDLLEFEAINAGGLPVEAARAHAAMNEYLWWLTREVILGFGRYHGPSVVRRHDESPQAYLNRMKHYPANLTLAAEALKQLAASSNTLTPVTDRIIDAASSKVTLDYDMKIYGQYVAAMEELQAPKPTEVKAELARAYGRPITGAWLADQIYVPLAGVLDVLEEDKPEAPMLAGFQKHVARALAVLSLLPDKAKELEDAADLLQVLKGKSGNAARATEPDVRRDMVDTLRRALEVLTPKVMLPEIVTRSSQRMEMESRLNDRAAHNRERTHRMWQEEVARQRRYYDRERVDALLRLATGNTTPGSAKYPVVQFAHSRIAARKSSGVQREGGGTLDIMIEGVSMDLLAMPRHLYEELLRANSEGYPKQFKQQGLLYIRRLLEDARQ